MQEPILETKQVNATTTKIGPSDELSVVVSYRLGEYLQVLLDFFPIEMHRRRQRDAKSKPGALKKPGVLAKGLLYAVGTMAYFYKVNKVGNCGFTINADGVMRLSKDGKLAVAWPEVVEVLKLSNAYLIRESDGAMPIPFRCLTESDVSVFERFAGAKLARSRTTGEPIPISLD